MKYQNLLQNLSKFIEKFPQLLASISLFSFLFPYFSSYLSSFFTYYSFSTFPFQLLNHAMDKNYVFLICNGIFLVLLANITSSEEDEEEEEEKAEEDGFLNEFQEAESPICIGTCASYLETPKEEIEVHVDEMSVQFNKANEVSLNVENSNTTIMECKQDEATSEEEKEEGGIEGEEEEKEEGGIEGEECSRLHERVEVDNFEENDFFNEEEEEVEESDEPLNKLSNEELNKKFEEFIRKMKEEIRIEARQQLVLVK